MNYYRVDRAVEARVPCGMNSISYIGDRLAAARRAFEEASIGVDVWGQPNPNYGVILSEWSAVQRDYVVIAQRLPHVANQGEVP